MTNMLSAVEDGIVPVGGALSILAGVVYVIVRQMWNQGSGWQSLMDSKDAENKRLREELADERAENERLRTELWEARRVK